MAFFPRCEDLGFNQYAKHSISIHFTYVQTYKHIFEKQGLLIYFKEIMTFYIEMGKRG